ncbi:MAG: PEP/pyruvate-binding domain-containing protein [Propionibacteriaceae bacterium]
MPLIDLTDVLPDQLAEVGGKAVGLASLIRAGETVPPGFVLTTEAYRGGVVPREQILIWWRKRLGSAPVAVRSSATAEDLPDASFAGQQDTILNVSDADALIEAIQQCWASLHSDRAVAYRAALPDGPNTDLAMGVIVQRMVDASAAGVLFTANPVTGLRSQQVINAVAGLGDVVVDGSVDSERAELDDGVSPPQLDCLAAATVADLQQTGRRIEESFGTPQDIEFAVDHTGVLWLLQSRAITTLFPVPVEDGDSLHVYVEVGHMQGLAGPMTPMGEEMMDAAIRGVTKMFGHTFRKSVRFIGGRMYMDLTPIVRSRILRRKLPVILETYGSTPDAADALLQDPRLRPSPPSVRALGVVLGPTIRGVTAFGSGYLGGLLSGLADPERARNRALSARVLSPTTATTPEGLLEETRTVQDEVMSTGMWEMLPALYAGLGSRAMAAGLLRGIAEPGEVDITQRGMPHNPTTAMDLALWQVAQRARPHHPLFTETPADELVARWRAGELPDIGLETFLESYGHRCAMEIDVGIPRWAEDPAPVFTVIAGYLRLTDPDQAPDVRFERAALEAEAMIDNLMTRADLSGHRRRGAAAGWLLRRGRQLSGLREYPKFAWVKSIRQGREQLLAVGAALAQRGTLGEPDDVFFLRFDEVDRALAGERMNDLAAARRAEYAREGRRSQAPPLLLSDGTMPTGDAAPPDGDAIVGRPAATGVATGRARVVRDPRTAHVEPGEILVAPTTDPGWTPLFMTAAGLVSDTGSPLAHGPTVARELGIPAVIGIRDATTRFKTGDLLTIDGSRGTVVVAKRATEERDAHADPKGDTC